MVATGCLGIANHDLVHAACGGEIVVNSTENCTSAQDIHLPPTQL